MKGRGGDGEGEKAKESLAEPCHRRWGGAM